MLQPVACALLLAGWVVPAWGQPVNGAGGGDTIIWGQEVFAIPYQWSGQTDPSQARQVVLHLSRDQGATWRQVSVAEPRVQSFTYRATGDGDYWFAVRTIDKAGTAWPRGPLTPELHVSVDTRIPSISSLSASVTPSGAVSVGCFVQDAHLDPSTVRVMVQDAGGWRELQTTPSMAANNATVVIRATGQVAAGTPQAAVRVSVVDRAGNPAEAGAVASLGTAKPIAAPLLSGPASTIAPPAGPFGFASQPSVAQHPVAQPLLPTGRGLSSSSVPRDPFLGQTPVFAPPTPSSTSSPAVTANAPNAVGGPPIGSPRVADHPWHSIQGPASPRQSRLQPVGAGKPSGGDVAWKPDGFSRAPYRGEAQPLTPVAPGVPTLAAQAAPPRGAPNPPSSVYHAQGPRSSFASLAPAGLPTSPGLAAGVPLSPLRSKPPAFRTAPLPEAAQFIASRRFELDYDVAAAGQWGVERVTLWGTRDRGKTWRTFAIDSDNRSPLDVSVDDEGLYGFRITVEGVGGLTPEGPRPGDAPELWVEVDRTEPQVRVTAAHQGEGYFGDHLVIHWQADDTNLASRPITLSYASRPDGPWAPMASSIENTGRYAWRLQRHLPSRLYLRVEAQDTAGNAGVAVTPQPLSIELPTPEATVRAVRPLGG